MVHDEAAELIPIYALDALVGDDLIAVEAHLASCEECRHELDQQRLVAAALVPDEPMPEDLWISIEDRLDTLPPEDRLDAVPPRMPPRVPARIPPRRTTTGSGIGANVPESDGVLPGFDGSSPDGAIGPPRSRRVVAWLAGAAAAVALILGGVSVYQAGRISELSERADVVAAAEAATDTPGAVVAEFVTEAGAVARVVLTREGEGFVIPLELDPLGQDRTYQLWVLTPDELVISAGVLGADPAPARFTWSGEVTGFALTREVAGGVVSSEGDVVAVAEV